MYGILRTPYQHLKACSEGKMKIKLLEAILSIGIVLFIFRNEYKEMFMSGNFGLTLVFIGIVLLIAIIPYHIITSATNKYRVLDDNKKVTDGKN